MASLRSFWNSHGLLAAVAILAALLVRGAIPTGYMVSQQAGAPQVLLCHGSAEPQADVLARTALRELAAVVALGKAQQTPAAASDSCPYAVLSVASLSGADPFQLAAAIAFVLALGIAVQRVPAIRRARFLRPPMRAPPALL